MLRNLRPDSRYPARKWSRSGPSRRRVSNPSFSIGWNRHAWWMLPLPLFMGMQMLHAESSLWHFMNPKPADPSAVQLVGLAYPLIGLPGNGPHIGPYHASTGRDLSLRSCPTTASFLYLPHMLRQAQAADTIPNQCIDLSTFKGP